MLLTKVYLKNNIEITILNETKSISLQYAIIRGIG
jgi:hypothetical protein